jgi:hypothetical protein
VQLPNQMLTRVRQRAPELVRRWLSGVLLAGHVGSQIRLELRPSTAFGRENPVGKVS